MFDKILLKSLKNKNVPLKIKRELDETKRSSFACEESAILLFDSVETLIDFNENVNVRSQFIKFYVYCLKATFKKLLELGKNNIEKKRGREMYKHRFNKYITTDMTDILQNQYFIVDDERTIKLMTFVWYTQHSCNTPQLIEVNQFDNKKRKWKKPNFSIKKYETFFGCEGSFGVLNAYPDYYCNASENNRQNKSQFDLENGLDYETEYEPQSVSQKSAQKSAVCGGYGVKLLNVIGEALNIKLLLNPFEHHAGTYVPYRGKDSDLMLIFESKYSKFSCQIFISTTEYFAVPPGIPYDAYEKLYLPFDLATWIWTLITFVVTFFTIFIVYQLNIGIQNILFGENVTTPSLNVLAHFFGISQTVMPQKHFARFLVMMFILLCFMIRNMYQGI
jgi:hypothetical protein